MKDELVGREDSLALETIRTRRIRKNEAFGHREANVVVGTAGVQPGMGRSQRSGDHH